MGERRALIIATDAYDNHDNGFPPLASPVRDAQELARVLQEPSIGNFSTKTLYNRGVQEIRDALEDFFSAGALDDFLLLFFSGHGYRGDDGAFGLATVGSTKSRPKASLVSAAEIKSLVVECRSRQKLILLDCCYSGAFVHAREMGESTGIDAGDFGGRGDFVITATSGSQTAIEDRIGEHGEVHSLFAWSLVQGLKSGAADVDRDGIVSFDELYNYLYDEIRAKDPKRLPRKSATDVEGTLVIARNPNPVEKPLPKAPEPPAPRPERPRRTRLVALVGSGSVLVLAAVVLVYVFWLRERLGGGGDGPPATAPTVSLDAVTDTTLTLSWSPVDRATGYTVLRTDPVPQRVYSGSGTSFEDHGLQANTNYRYQVSSMNSFGNGPVANVLYATAPAPPRPTSEGTPGTAPNATSSLKVIAPKMTSGAVKPAIAGGTSPSISAAPAPPDPFTIGGVSSQLTQRLADGRVRLLFTVLVNVPTRDATFTYYWDRSDRAVGAAQQLHVTSGPARIPISTTWDLVIPAGKQLWERLHITAGTKSETATVKYPL